MTSSQASSPVISAISSPVSRSRSSTKLADDVTSLTSFNFLEEDVDDQSSYALVTSLLSRVKNSFSAPLSSAASGTSSAGAGLASNAANVAEPRRPSFTLTNQSSFSSRPPTGERQTSFAPASSKSAPPLVSLTPAQSEVPTYNADYDRSPSRGGMFYSPSYESSGDGGMFGTSIPGFPIQDDARSIKTSGSLHRSGSVSKVIRRIRGEGKLSSSWSSSLSSWTGLSRDYWMDDENCKECYDCKSVFTTWRRKHHCRICGTFIVPSETTLLIWPQGQIFCSRCASNIIKGSRFGHDGMVRVCNLCLEKLAKVDDDDDDDRRSIISTVTSFPAHQLGAEMTLAHHPQSPFAASQLFGRTDEPFNLYSIAETKRPVSGSDESGFGSRPITPRLMERDDGVWEAAGENVVPFRRAVSDEEKENVGVFNDDGSPSAHTSKTPIEFPTMGDDDGPTSSIQFPVGSPEHGDSPNGLVRSRFDSYADFDGATPFIRSRVQSRLDNLTSIVEPGWRTRRESTA